METTKENYEMFTDNVKYWLGFFGLYDWGVDMKHEEPPTDDGSNPMAYVVASLDDRYAVIYFNTEAPESLVNTREIMQHAFHEVCEMLLMELNILAQMRFNVSTDRMEAASHAIIQRLINCIWEEEYSDYVDTRSLEAEEEIAEEPEEELPSQAEVVAETIREMLAKREQEKARVSELYNLDIWRLTSG